MAFCPQCGSALAMGAQFCAGCGAALAALASPAGPAPAMAVAPPFPPSPPMDDPMVAFVGNNFDFYQRKWAIADKSAGKQSWNWAAFFLGLGWMAYRKMYLYSAIYIGGILLLTLMEYVLGLSEKMSLVMSFAIAVAVGFHGNHLYQLHAREKVRAIVSTVVPDRVGAELARQGGTNVGIGIASILVLFVVLFVEILVLEFIFY